MSEAACLQASANAVLHRVEARADIRQSDWFADVDETFDLIASNPPYLAGYEMDEVAPELRDHEPRVALTDEGDGLSAYRVIASQAAQYLNPNGRVMVEIGWQQGASVRTIFEKNGWSGIVVMPDLGGRDRVIHAQLA